MTHPHVTWLVERLEECAPRDDIQTFDELRSRYHRWLEVDHALNTQRGMVLGLVLSSSAYAEALEVIPPLLRRGIARWERFLLERFGRDAIVEIQVHGGARLDLPGWIQEFQRILDGGVCGRLAAAAERTLALRAQVEGGGFVDPSEERAGITDVNASIQVSLVLDGLHHALVAPIGVTPQPTMTLQRPRDLQLLMGWARDATQASPSLTLTMQIVLLGPEVVSVDRQWSFVVRGLLDARTVDVRVRSWPPRDGPGPSPGGCSSAIVLRTPHGVRLVIRVSRLNVDQSGALKAWAEGIAREAGAPLAVLDEGAGLNASASPRTVIDALSAQPREDLARVSRERFGRELARAVWRKLMTFAPGRGLLSSHRNPRGQALVREGGARVVLWEIDDDWPAHERAEWNTEEDFVAFWSEQSDFSASGADPSVRAFSATGASQVGSQRITAAHLRAFVGAQRPHPREDGGSS